MLTLVRASFEVTSWEETPFRGEDAPLGHDGGSDGNDGRAGLTRAEVSLAYTGDIEGESNLVYLLAYAGEGGASFVGMERITGTINDREGSIVLQHRGTYEDNDAQGSLTVVRGAGTGELASVTGSGNFKADPTGTIVLDVSL